MIHKAKYSDGQNLRAAFERGTEKKMRMMAPMMPPKTDAQREIPIASPALPFLRRGYPSNAVTVADGVPGVLIATAVIDPP